MGNQTKLTITLTRTEAQALLAVSRAGVAAILPSPSALQAMGGKAVAAAARRAIGRLEAACTAEGAD